MNRARVIVLGVAVVAGLGAALMARNLGGETEIIVEKAEEIPVAEVLVASGDIEAGHIVTPSQLKWQAWPEDNIAEQFIRRDMDPDAVEELDGAVARTMIFAGEPVRNSKLAIAGPGGFLAATLPTGMRAVSAPISERNSAGGFILPNDRVDVLLTQNVPDPANPDNEILTTETVLENIRVLAIDQVLEEEDGAKVVVGDVATLELTPRQAEVLALVQQLGDISLILRSILDGDPDVHTPNAAEHLLTGGRRGEGVTVIRFGVANQEPSFR